MHSRSRPYLALPSRLSSSAKARQRMASEQLASEELKEFLRSIKAEYVQYAELLHEGTFTDKAELSGADKTDLVALGVPNGAAGLIIRTAQGIVQHCRDPATSAQALAASA
ncbi:hypothetical protein WJX72_000463 [[Myrmecia] bisecta]|uniref:SAM domain-containing protein n=1 Tax=[Myrmecia] bisecta TaxID=41462 RepID=A0AAW1QE15_9CHLO